jgi:hypothetical protein
MFDKTDRLVDRLFFYKVSSGFCNFADFMKKFCSNLQKLQICRTLQECAKKVQKKCGELQILQFFTDLHPKKSPDG